MNNSCQNKSEFSFLPSRHLWHIQLPHHVDYITGYNVGHWIFIKWGIMGSGGRRDTTGSIWCRACTQDCLLFISFALGRFTYWGQNGFKIAYTSKLRQNVQEREKFKNDHGTFQFLPHMGGFQLVIRSITTLILHVTHYKIGVL